MSRVRRFPLISILVSVLVAASVLVAPVEGVSAATGTGGSTTTRTATLGPTSTLVTDGFRAGNIISDAKFFDSMTMTAGEIDAFFRSKVQNCQSGYTCLKDYRQNTPNRPADQYCKGYTGAPNESAATIIYRVAQSCGINPQVFIVMLQKEQSLVTHTWPSDWRYTKALGQGCPDTAPCDPQFAGFFYQIYGAGRQMKIYTEGRYFTWYAPGKTWNILYNPERACGSAPVYIENSATSALYYYTPYQPNAAALRAGYGIGDACSAYGNRNFYNYFKDWFGDPRGGGVPARGLVRASGQAEMYLINAGVKSHVVAWEDYLAFRSALGEAVTVSPGALDAIPSGPSIRRYVHDARSGTLFLLEADGTRHRFDNAAQIALFGYAFNAYVNLEPALVDRFSRGADVGAFIRSGSASEINVVQAGKRRYVSSIEAWQEVSAGTPGYVASVDPAAFARIPEGTPVFARHSLVRTQGAPEVYLALSSGALVWVPNLSLAAEAGATRMVMVPPSAIHSAPLRTGALSPVVACGSTRYLASSGRLDPISGTDTTGFIPAQLTAEDCGWLPRTTSTLSGNQFVQQAGRGEVFLLQQGRLRHVQDYARLVELNGNRALHISTWQPATASWVGTAGPVLSNDVFVQFAGQGAVYWHRSGGVLHHVQDYATLVRLGNGRVPPIQSLQAHYIHTYRFGTPLLREGQFVRIGDAPEVYVYEAAQLHHVRTETELRELNGGVVPEILVIDKEDAATYPVGTPAD
ncbi:hypothetical protein [Microbacterium sp. EF45047]|uniref:hypothetical protein n=1 Tax=Microbacterium sp. EF45047 TaxID=2809708 RepID=UPI00234A35CA|nr:hypothetical protein [Microbacterium sp. EF45047]WCM56354.1 hypothetical protein JRG78_03910 [Microbacterium sp. EF45047]